MIACHLIITIDSANAGAFEDWLETQTIVPIIASTVDDILHQEDEISYAIGTFYKHQKNRLPALLEAILQQPWGA